MACNAFGIINICKNFPFRENFPHTLRIIRCNDYSIFLMEPLTLTPSPARGEGRFIIITGLNPIKRSFFPDKCCYLIKICRKILHRLGIKLHNFIHFTVKKIIQPYFNKTCQLLDKFFIRNMVKPVKLVIQTEFQIFLILLDVIFIHKFVFCINFRGFIKNYNVILKIIKYTHKLRIKIILINFYSFKIAFFFSLFFDFFR